MNQSGIRITSSDLQSFDPVGLGVMAVKYRAVLAKMSNKKQSEMLRLLEREVTALETESTDVEVHVYKVSLLVLRDYILAGHYPFIRDGRCYLANVAASESFDSDAQRNILKSRYRAARAHAFVDRGQTKWLGDASALIGTSRYAPHDVLAALRMGPPEIALLTAGSVDRSPGSRTLWRTVRATWSMGVEASAPGREVSVLATDSRWPQVPLGILQLRNVVPEIRARDDWLALAAGDGLARTGFLGRLAGDPKSAKDRAAETRDVLTKLFKHVNKRGLGTAARRRDIDALGELSRSQRRLFDETRSAGGKQGLDNEHLKTVKRAQTAQDLLRGINTLEKLASGAAIPETLPPKELADLDAGLRKLWHYHMGFVAVELSICGAAPPFGPARVGKLMAALAGSANVMDLWGIDRPLGQISTVVYDASVRDDVPNPGPLVLFTSGLYPGHSAQYNRVAVGNQRWRKIGETTGFGNFHISFQTTEAMRRLNAAIDGYAHISRTFGEGSGARFRSVGRALAYAGLPDLRKHATKRPLYALPLVSDPSAVLLGWSALESAALPSAAEIARRWWQRWVEPAADSLITSAKTVNTLSDELSVLMREVNQIQLSKLDAPETLFEGGSATGT